MFLNFWVLTQGKLDLRIDLLLLIELSIWQMMEDLCGKGKI